MQYLENKVNFENYRSTFISLCIKRKQKQINIGLTQLKGGIIF